MERRQKELRRQALVKHREEEERKFEDKEYLKSYFAQMRDKIKHDFNESHNYFPIPLTEQDLVKPNALYESESPRNRILSQQRNPISEVSSHTKSRTSRHSRFMQDGLSRVHSPKNVQLRIEEEQNESAQKTTTKLKLSMIEVEYMPKQDHAPNEDANLPSTMMIEEEKVPTQIKLRDNLRFSENINS